MAIYSDSGFITARDTPLIRPTLDLNFAREKRLDSRVTFTRASSATYTDEYGVVRTVENNVPRFDHDPVTGESLGLLIEESRTNYYTTSETMLGGRVISPSQWTWTSFAEGGPQGGSFIRWQRIGTAASPEWNYDIFYNNTGLSVGQQFAVSFYARCPNGTLSSIKLSNPDAEEEVFNIDSTWRRFTKVFTYGAQNGLTFLRFNRGHTPTYVNGATYDLAALQIENRPFPTSYIPTSGSTVTRAADLASISGTNFTEWYNPTEGTLFIHGERGKLANLMGVTINNSSSPSDNRIEVRFSGGNLTATRFIINSNATGYTDTIVDIDDLNKLIFAFKQNDAIPCVNGDLGTLDTITEMPINANRLEIGYTSAFASQYTGTIRSLKYYPKRLPNTQLQALTS